MNTIIRKHILGCFVSLLMLWASPLNAKILNTSGTWKLNAEKSDYGKLPKPKSVMVKVVHKEPAFKYSVTGTDAEGKAINVEFDGAIDGKAFGNPAEVDQRIRRVKANMVVGKKLYPRC